MGDNNEEIEKLFNKMMEEFHPSEDETYLADMKNFEGFLKVQWKICEMEGYQIFEKDNYSFKIGEKLDNPDVTIEIKDKDQAIRFLKCKFFPFSYTIDDKGLFKMTETTGWKVVKIELGDRREKVSIPFLTAQFNLERGIHPLNLSKLPVFRDFASQAGGDEGEFGSYLPINKSLGTFENLILPEKVFKHFIDKASNIFIRDCPCRVGKECQDHSVALGCMVFGRDSVNIVLREKGRGHFATKEEAMEHVKNAIADGLIPVLGRAMVEADGYGIIDTGHFLTVCWCCSCCCVNGRLAANVSGDLITLFHKVEGLTVEVDQDICTGCGDCLEVCVFTGMEMDGDKARVNQDRCWGCGRCETTCPSEAISITLDDPKRIDDWIKTLETYVDVT